MSNLLLRRLSRPSLVSRWLNVRFATQTTAGESTAKRGMFGNKPEAAESTDEKKHDPIAFLNTRAGKWRPVDDDLIAHHGRPKYQDLVISASLIVFMIYFFILREENDIDRKLTRSIDQTMYDIELAKLNDEYQRKITDNQNVDSIKERLKEMGHPV